jgi:hypothetical protein
MLNSDGTKTGRKPNSRKAKAAQDGDKARQRKRKAAAQVPVVDQAPAQVPVVDQAQDIPEVSSESVVQAETAAPLPPTVETPPIVPAVEESTPVSYKALADAWGNYSRTSLEQTRSYFEKLAGVRSLGAAFEVQAEFAKQACDTFVAQSQKIGELQGELARQRLKRIEGFVEKMTLGATSTRQS